MRKQKTREAKRIARPWMHIRRCANLLTSLSIAILTAGMLLIGATAQGQNDGDFRSRKSGNWNDGCTWERYDGTLMKWIPQCAFPEVGGTASSAKTDPAGTLHIVALPDDIEAGDLLLVFWVDAADDATDPGTPAGWTDLYPNAPSIAGNRVRRAWYRVADGTEGATLGVTAGAERSAHIAYRITAGTYELLPVAAIPDAGNTNAADPPPLNPGFFPANANMIRIAAAHSEGDGNNIGTPGSFGDPVNSYTGNVGTAHAKMVTAHRTHSLANLNPGTFNNYSAARQWAAGHVAVKGIGPTSTPTQADGEIAIRLGHTVTITAAVTADQVLVQKGGILVVNDDLTLANGPGIDLDVSGIVYHGDITTPTPNGTFNILAGAAIEFREGGTYILMRTGSDRVVPTATWHPKSLVTIGNWPGATNGPSNLLGQTFGDFQVGPFLDAGAGANTGFLVPSGSGTLTVAGDFTLNNGSPATRPIGLNNGGGTVVLDVGGNFFLPAGVFRLNNAGGDVTLNISGNLQMSGGTFNMKDGNGPAVINLGGDFIKTGGDFNHRVSGTANASIVNIKGSFTQTDGLYDMAGANAEGILNVGGDFTISGGTLTKTSGNANGFGSINFTGAGAPQVYTSGATVSNLINFTVESGAYLQMESPETTVTGGGEFTLEADATLGIRSAAGISTVGATGNVQVSGIRRYNIGANYIYNGFTAQNTGAGLPLMVKNLTFDNIAGPVTFNAARDITEKFSIAILSKANLASFVHTAGTLELGGEGQLATGSWGHPVSLATNQSIIYFTENGGVVNVLAPLPIELLYFKAEKQDEKTALLSWATATELNNDYMAVERSGDGLDWKEIGRVSGAGTTTEPQTYSLLDENPMPGLNYYRLRQVDFDGVVEYFNTVALDFRHFNLSPLTFNFFPNPAGDRITLRLSQRAVQDGELFLLDMQGRLLQRSVLPAGALQHELDLSNLPTGIYLVRLRVGAQQEVLRLVKE
ncbi:MAG: T9SS type A sorting domain-containing protein [Saprospiraceae bacterium]|nr:T9SS type A sorting domain-containing protein [Saprospiraceae bacterium]